MNMATNQYRNMNISNDSGMSLQESIANMVQYPNKIEHQDDAIHGLQSLSLMDDQPLHDNTSINSENNHIPMENQACSQSPVQGQSVSQDGIGLATGVSRSFQHGVIISHNVSVSSTVHELPPPAEVQQRKPPCLGLLGGNPSSQHHQCQQQHRENTLTSPTIPQTVSRQQNTSNELLSVLGHVRSPLHASYAARLNTFLRWPLNITQKPKEVAEAGFYYTGFQDVVRCFACDGGLKNWDPEDVPWIEHARWFPQCSFVRHVKGEEFINLVRMSTEESDEEDDCTLYRGVTWQGDQNANTSPDSGKQDCTGQKNADANLKKGMHGELSNFNLSANCPPSFGNSSATEQVMSENKHLKGLLQCTECRMNQRNILFLPCTHHVVCESCSRNLHICNICDRKIREKVRTYMS